MQPAFSKSRLILFIFLTFSSGLLGQNGPLSPCEQAEYDVKNDIYRPMLQLDIVYKDSLRLDKYISCYEVFLANKEPEGMEGTLVDIVHKATMRAMKDTTVNNVYQTTIGALGMRSVSQQNKVKRFKNATVTKNDSDKIELQTVWVYGDSLVGINKKSGQFLYFHGRDLQGLTIKKRFWPGLGGAIIGGGGTFIIDYALGNPLSWGVLGVAPLNAAIGLGIGFVRGKPIEYKYELAANTQSLGDSTSGVDELMSAGLQNEKWNLVKQPARRPNVIGLASPRSRVSDSLSEIY